MKATINGVTYEGTYDEITAIVDRRSPRFDQSLITSYQERLKEYNEQLTIKLKEAMRTGTGQADYLKHQTTITSNQLNGFASTEERLDIK